MGFARSTTVTERLPADDTGAWREIYSALAHVIGEPAAWSWFADCRFIERTHDQLTLAHWSGFSASECLRRHGRELAKVAGVKSIKIMRSGGYRPAHVDGVGRQRRGFALYRAEEARKPVDVGNILRAG